MLSLESQRTKLKYDLGNVKNRNYWKGYKAYWYRRM